MLTVPNNGYSDMLLSDLDNLQKNLTIIIEGENNSEICEVD
jgi:hypothetical protein